MNEDPRSLKRTEDLARAAQSGEQERFTELYERIAPALFAWARLRIGPKLSRHLDANDLLHEVWWRALRSFAQFEGKKGSFRGWIFTIATRCLLNARRGAARQHQLRGAIEDDLRDRVNRSEEVVRVSAQLRKQEFLGEAVDILGQLSPEDRQLALLCGLEGLSSREAGPLLSLSPEATRQRWSRLRTKLRSQLGSPDLLA